MKWPWSKPKGFVAVGKPIPVKRYTIKPGVTVAVGDLYVPPWYKRALNWIKRRFRKRNRADIYPLW